MKLQQVITIQEEFDADLGLANGATNGMNGYMANGH